MTAGPHDSLKLSVLFGESDRSGHQSLADALLAELGRRRLRKSILLRGAEGFGIKQRMRSQRLLTLSEDLPLVAIAVDEPQAIEGALEPVMDMIGDGLVTIERAATKPPPGGQTKLTVLCGRREPFTRAVDILRRSGVDGATALLGVDGTVRGERRRARFFAGNDDVPLMIVSVGDAEALARALPELREALDDPLLTFERVRIGEPHEDVAAPLWQKLTVYSNDQSLHAALIRRLRAEGAAGATSLRGVWGYHGDHGPHGDRLLALRRGVPAMTVVVDEPQRARRWFEIAAEATAHGGLVTSEIVPAAHPAGPGAPAEGIAVPAIE